ncbi:MAG: DUF512 domain-containing protein [Lachnospiraceae bacterium]|nr:DUF512 domain-containing protein [Lachnospiraceae bacterium]
MEADRRSIHKNAHIVKKVLPGSIAEEMEIEPGDEIISINEQIIEDIFDFQFLCMDEEITVLVRKPDGEEWELDIEKEENEDLGVEFENGLMDDYRSCHNKCIFCFIDQNPPGMRETLYFKDDDSRLSFLQGNYITLTNMSDHDIDRMIHYHLEPINISFHTMNPELRCKMLNNRFAGDALKKVDKLYEAGITMNGQIVSCPGINDGKELEYSLEKLLSYAPVLQSVSVVPVGLTKYRDGLYPLESYTKETAAEVIDIIERYQQKAIAKGYNHFVHASDEWYIVAEREFPEEERYDGYLQLANGVGTMRLLIEESVKAIVKAKKEGLQPSGEKVTFVTGVHSYDTVKEILDQIKEEIPGAKPQVYKIMNEFYGHHITVTGLLTGGDLYEQLKEQSLGDKLIISENMLRSGEEVFLDDMTVTELSEKLNIPIQIVSAEGEQLVLTALGLV